MIERLGASRANIAVFLAFQLFLKWDIYLYNLFNNNIVIIIIIIRKLLKSVSNKGRREFKNINIM